MRVVLIGAGRLATNLAHALRGKGHEIAAVFSRTAASATALATAVGAVPVTRIDQLPREADVFVLAVKDAVLAQVAAQLAEGRVGQLFVHTAGSVPMSLFEGLSAHYGVLYPMQTFSKERLVDFSRVPLFIEAVDQPSLNTLQALAQSLSSSVTVLSSEARRHLHLAAVFACNFANHCYALSAGVLREQGLPFSVMLPLIDETAAKVHAMAPDDAQTGPAVRYDENVIQAQAALLSCWPTARAVYELMSKSIHELSKNND